MVDLIDFEQEQKRQNCNSVTLGKKAFGKMCKTYFSQKWISQRIYKIGKYSMQPLSKVMIF